jgi:hypothetical protein
VTVDRIETQRSGAELDDRAPTETALLFVYNADSGLLNSVRDQVHKTVSPSTYRCNLCALTYGGLGMRRSWARFTADLDLRVEFLHRDELSHQYGIDDVELPTLLLWDGGEASLLIPAEEMNDIPTLDELMSRVEILVRGIRENRQ